MKTAPMSHEEINSKIAAACGQSGLPLPRYTESRDACADFLKTLGTAREQRGFIWWLNKLHPTAEIHLTRDDEELQQEVFEILTASPMQLCVAFINLKNL